MAVPDSILNTSYFYLQSRINNGEAEWKKRFQFLIRNPLTEELKLKVHNEHNKPIGSITVRLSRLLAASEMTLQDWLPLESTEQNSEIRVKLQLRILTPDVGAPSPQGKTKAQYIKPRTKKH
ncbi:hypothetical protein XELAEV_18027952mg [Xenopus laevis]|uniref:Uncharacterized protein n=1 Tax=Xenopus laevis TaxID=8355 RepID=A0A974HK84_XENLA|nr:hypothetical protein XELAEV_18027952mg [Xenopus laevis]